MTLFNVKLTVFLLNYKNRIDSLDYEIKWVMVKRIVRFNLKNSYIILFSVMKKYVDRIISYLTDIGRI